MPNINLKVLYLDNHLLVINKPAGLLTQADRTGDPDLLTLAKAFLKEKFDKPGRVFLGLVHRLDRPVSGVMVFARTSKAAARISEQFRKKLPGKRYLAIVEGDCRGEGKYVDYLLKDKENVRIVKPSHPKAQYAELEWKMLSRQAGLSLLDIKLITGRPHQIRVQFSHKGFPILGDFRYGAKKEFDGKNLALHCYALRIEHPVKKEKMEWKTQPPMDWHHFFGDKI